MSDQMLNKNNGVHQESDLLSADLSGLRLRKSAEAEQLGIPSKKLEKWKYTSFSTVLKDGMTPASKNYELDHIRELLSSELAMDSALRVVTYNGELVSELSNLDSIDGVSCSVVDGVRAKEAFAGSDGEIDLSAERINELYLAEVDAENYFEKQNLAQFAKQLNFKIQQGRALEKPIVVIHLAGSPLNEELSNQNVSNVKAIPSQMVRLHLTIESGAEVSLLEIFKGENEDRYFTNSLFDARLRANSKLSYCRVQAEGTKGMHFGSTRIKQDKNSSTELFQYTLGSTMSRQDLQVELMGEGAETIVDGLYLLNQNQHADHSTSIEHRIGNTQSSQIYKGVLNEDAKAIFNGRIYIAKDAQKANASQLNKTLLLSKKAEIDTKPELEIYADDVKASHGATVGQLDEDQIFYLESRAIPRNDAIRILSRGFAEEIVLAMSNEFLKSAVHLLLDEKFNTYRFDEEQ